MNRRVFIISQCRKQFLGIQKVDNGRFRFLRDYFYDSSVTPYQVQYIQAGFSLTKVSMAHDTELSCSSDLCI